MTRTRITCRVCKRRVLRRLGARYCGRAACRGVAHRGRLQHERDKALGELNRREHKELSNVRQRTEDTGPSGPPTSARRRRSRQRGASRICDTSGGCTAWSGPRSWRRRAVGQYALPSGARCSGSWPKRNCGERRLGPTGTASANRSYASHPSKAAPWRGSAGRPAPASS